MIRLFFALALFALPTIGFAAAAPNDPSLVVKLTSGTFQGVNTAAPGNTNKWLGVPFAQPPVGSLRFKAPVAITNPSRSVQNASQFGNACPQEASGGLGAPIGEDCLFLNVRPSHLRATFESDH